MDERAISEASAFALDRRNFDYLPDELALNWRSAFLRARRRKIAGPRKLIVELVNACNFDCPMCRVGQHGIDLSRKMPLHVFEALLRQVDTLTTVRLNGLGESTLLPDFGSYVTALTQLRVRAELISNGSGDLSCYALIADADGHILISWDAAQERTFEQLRRPARWSEQKRRLAKIADYVARGHSGKCSLIFTLQKANVGELCGVVELAAELRLSSIQVNVAKTPKREWLSANLARIQTDLTTSKAMAESAGIPLYIPSDIEGLTLPGGLPTASLGCAAPWDEAVVRWNGDVQVCNMFNPYTYGNIHRHPFMEIWRNTFAEVFRQKVNGSERHPYCRGCVYMPAAYA